MTSFSVKVAERVLSDVFGESEIEAVKNKCGEVESVLSEKRTALNPKALAATAAHLYRIDKGMKESIEKTANEFGVSSSTLREYLNDYTRKGTEDVNIKSYAYYGAQKYLEDEYGAESAKLGDLCELVAKDLSRKRGYLHPRALAAVTAYIHMVNIGGYGSIEEIAGRFEVSPSTLREYVKQCSLTPDPITAARSIIERSIKTGIGELNEIQEICERLYEKLRRKKTSLHPNALVATSVYIYYYKTGRRVSIGDIANRYRISPSTIREYALALEDEMGIVERAKTFLLSVMDESDERRIDAILEKLSGEVETNTPRILAALAMYLISIEDHKYTSIESVARMFGVSIPALRTYLQPYYDKISDSYLLTKRGGGRNIEALMGRMSDAERQMLRLLYQHFNHSLFELNDVYELDYQIPRGRWQLFLRKLAEMEAVHIYRKPIDPKQYMALVEEWKFYLKDAERLERWV